MLCRWVLPGCARSVCVVACVLRCCVVLCVLPVGAWCVCVEPGCCSVLLAPVAVAWSPVMARGCVLSCGAVPRCSGVPPVVWCAAVCVVSCWWCRAVSFPLPGAACCRLWLPAIRCWVWLPTVVFRWCVLSPVLLPGRVACCPAVCCGLLWCPTALCCVLCSLVLCCRVVPCCGALPSRFLCWWCWFLSFPCVCGALLRCVSCCSVPVWSALLLVPRPVVCRCVLWCLSRCSVVWWCCCVCPGVLLCGAVCCDPVYYPAHQQATKVLLAVTNYLEGNQLLVHNVKSATMVHNAPPPSLRPGDAPMNPVSTATYLGVQQAATASEVTLPPNLKRQLTRTLVIARIVALSTQAPAFFRQATLNADIGFQALHLTHPQQNATGGHYHGTAGRDNPRPPAHVTTRGGTRGVATILRGQRRSPRQQRVHSSDRDPPAPSHAQS